MNPELHILKSLALVNPLMMTVGTLWSEVNLAAPRTAYSTFMSALRSLEEKGQVVVVDGEDRKRAKITDAGLARLYENNL